jgi:hypothetical protein
MVTTKLYGRLGNQLFQLAATYAFAKRNSDFFVFPHKTINPSVFPYYWNKTIETEKQATEIDRLQNTVLIYEPSNLAYKEIKPIRNTNLILDGYFQSEKYFKDLEHETVIFLKSILEKELKNSERFFGAKLFLEKFDIPKIAIQIRRGDYLQLADKHPFVGEEYLIDSITSIIEKYGKSVCIIFSDDMHWCQSFFQKEANHRLKSIINKICFLSEIALLDDTNPNPIDSLLLMAECDHFIISNSSYGWWGSYLSDNTYKQIIAPAKWYGPANAHINTNDLIPQTWTQL